MADLLKTSIVLVLIILLLRRKVSMAAVMPLMGAPTPSPPLVALAFAAGFAGVILSPLHLCYVLTCEYFRADIARVYHRLFLPSALVMRAILFPLNFW